MSETEIGKQENQKTVVAFVTGLLIGGLLVWVFSSTPEQASAPKEVDDSKATESVTKEDEKSVTPSTVATTPATPEVVGEGSIAVADQKAGKTVALGALKLPTKNGWVVVRDYMDGVPGNILGAARYSTEEGLTPTSIELMRATVVGSSYQVVFFSNYGDKGFKLGEDQAIGDITATFKAIK